MNWQIGIAVLAMGVVGCKGGGQTPEGPLWPPEERPFLSVRSLDAEARELIDQMVVTGLERYTREAIVRQFHDNVLASDMDGDGLSRSDFVYQARSAEARGRLTAMSDLIAADIDLDGRVSRAELRRAKAIRAERNRKMEEIREAAALRAPRRSWYDIPPGGSPSQPDTLRATDGDGDGFITLEEAYRDPPPAAGRRRPMRGPVPPLWREFDRMAPLDLNRDGLITRREVDTAINLYLDEARQVGVVFGSRGWPDSGPREDVQPACAISRPSQGAELISLSLSPADTLSSVSVAGQDEVTTTSEVTVEPGSRPLFVVAASQDAHIWRFKGAVNRIERLVVVSSERTLFGRPAAGETGVPRERTTIAPYDCLKPDNHQIDVMEGRRADRFSQQLGRVADRWINPNGVVGMSVAIPSGKTYPLAAARPSFIAAGGKAEVEAAWKEAIRFSPGGVRELDPQAVVAGARAEAYEVLPRQAGIAQLIAAGAVSGDGPYRIHRPIRFPAGLAGGHSVTFILDSGVSYPKGNKGHSCIYKTIWGRFTGQGCPRGHGDGDTFR